MISKSGESEELLNLVPFAKLKKTRLLAMVSNEKSRLSQVVDQAIHLPLDRELCPFDLAPTTSTVIQLIFGEVLAIALMKAKKFSIQDYAFNHPSGAIGKKLILKVEDLMLTGAQLPLCRQENRLGEVLVELTNKRSGCLLVVDSKNELSGIFTDGDLRRALQVHGPKVLDEQIQSLMTFSPLAASKDELAWEAMKRMQKDPKKWVMILPVLENRKVVGLLRMHDIVNAGL